MKKLSKIKNLLSREDMKQIQGGNQLLTLDGTAGGASATCYCNDSIQDINDDCQWCHLACMNYGGYKGVCILW